MLAKLVSQSPDRRLEYGLLMAIITMYITLGLVYALVTPPWQVPDEPAHYNYVRFLVEEKRLPILHLGDYDQAYLEEIKHEKFASEYPIDSIRYEFHQPPLYYLFLAPVYTLNGGSLLALRVVTILFGAGTLVTVFLVAKTMWSKRPWAALAATAFVALIPQHIAMTAAVENDALAELLIGLVLWRLARWIEADGPWSWKQLAGIGLLCGLGLLTKTAAYITLPLIAIAAAIRFWPKGHVFYAKRAARGLGLMLIPALLLGSIWWVRNISVYGRLDVLGLHRHEEVVVGQPRTVDLVAGMGWAAMIQGWTKTTFHSFWAQFGWMAVPIDKRVYIFLGLLSIAALLGLVLRTIDRWPIRPQATSILLLCSFGLTAASVLWYNLSFYQAQGRYLFPALIPIGIAWVTGLEEILKKGNALALGIVLGLATLTGLGRCALGICADKWRVLITGAGSTFFVGRGLLPFDLGPWFMAATYVPLVALCAVSPFLFIAPYLTP